MVRSLKRSKDLQIRGALGRALVSHRNRDYWREVRKIRGKKKSNAAVVNGYTESKDIANEFANKYSLLYNSVRSDPDELHSLAYNIDDGIQSSCMHDHCSFTHRITIEHIVESVQLLRPGKSGGANGVMSDSFIHGTNLLYQYILVLFNAMLTHGVSPDDFKISILIPIPKGARVDKSNASNYRAVALSSILGKMLDMIIINVQKEELETSDLQFGYKSNSSTIMCSTLLIESIQYFVKMQSPGYELFIDASKAFDRVCHSHLFNILEERGVCPLIRRLLIKLYKNQRIRVRWNTCLSDISGISNGVKQGAVLSPILFTDYIDNLLARLRESGVGCHIGGVFAGAFGYADDIVLLAPSLDALRHMIGICEDYAQEFHILFNPSKSKLMYYNVSHDNLHVKLCNQDVHIVSKKIYLGNYISENIYDRSIKQTVCAFNAKSNQIISDFSMLDCFSLHKLHTTYCMSLYGCEIWNYNSRYIDEMFIAWRKIMRKLFKLPNRTHNYIVCGIIECISIKLDRRLAKFVYSMLNSRNLTVFKLIRLFLQSDSSTFAENVRYLMYKYEIPIFVWERDFSDVIKYVHNKQVISPIQLSEVDSVKELCKMRDGVLFSDLSKRDIQILIDVICIS